MSVTTKIGLLLHFEILTVGTYLIRVGNIPARKVVVRWMPVRSILKSTKVVTFVESNPHMFKLLWILFFAHVNKDVVLIKKSPTGKAEHRQGCKPLYNDND